MLDLFGVPPSKDKITSFFLFLRIRSFASFTGITKSSEGEVGFGSVIL
jgi:hypothetical protein